MWSALRIAMVGLVLVGCGGDDDGETPADGRPVDAPEVDAMELDAMELDATEIDAMEIDAPPGPALPFDVAYADTWTFSGVTGADTRGIGLVINPSANLEALDLSGLQVVSVVDDHPLAVVQVSITIPAAAPLPAGSAAGDLSLAAETHIGPLVTEPRADSETPQLAFAFGGLAMPTNAVIHVTAVVRNGSQQVTLPFVFTLQASGASVAVTGASRVTSAP